MIETVWFRRIWRLGFVLPLMLAVTAYLVAQEPTEVHGLAIKNVPQVPTPTPFPLDVHIDSAPSLKFLSLDQISAADRQLVDANLAEIIRRAGLQGFGPVHELAISQSALASGLMSQQKTWDMEQAVCPVMPGYVILEFSRNVGGGDVSLFSAVIPRGEGHVRVIPVRRRGYSLWTPASSNTLTVHDFNVLVEKSGLSADWLTTGLCYAALAGGHVRTAMRAELPESFPLYPPAVLRVSRKGGAEVDITDASHLDKGMVWSLDFAQDGRLLKVRHSNARVLTEKPVLGPEVDTKGTPVKESPIDLEAGKH